MTNRPSNAFALAANNVDGFFEFLRKDMGEFASHPLADGNFYQIFKDDRNQPTLQFVGVRDTADPSGKTFKSSQVYTSPGGEMGFATGQFQFDENGEATPAGFTDDQTKTELFLKRGDILNAVDSWRGENNQAFEAIMSAQPQPVAATTVSPA